MHHKMGCYWSRGVVRGGAQRGPASLVEFIEGFGWHSPHLMLNLLKIFLKFSENFLLLSSFAISFKYLCTMQSIVISWDSGRSRNEVGVLCMILKDMVSSILF